MEILIKVDFSALFFMKRLALSRTVSNTETRAAVRAKLYSNEISNQIPVSERSYSVIQKEYLKAIYRK
jgi:hypothetical protein